METDFCTHPPLSEPLRLKFPRGIRSRTVGAALILTLGMLVLLTGLVLAFLMMVRTESGASKAYVGGTDARQLADSALNLVIGQIRDASTQPGLAWTSQPGLIRTFDTSGKAVKNYKLYSADSLVEDGTFNPASGTDLPAATATITQPGLWTDLNSPVVDQTRTDPFDATKKLKVYPIFDGNHMQSINDPAAPAAKVGVLSLKKDGTSDIEGFKVSEYDTRAVTMPVKWLYMLKDGTLAPAQASGAAGDVQVMVPAGKETTAQGEANSVVARVAFWTDDETAKVNINTASEGTFLDTPMATALPLANPEGSYDQTVPDATFEWELANRQGASKEYQRYPGHPATTALTPIFGRQLLLRFNGNDPTKLLPPASDAFRAQVAEEIYKFAPRISGAEYNGNADPTMSLVVRDNSSKSGTARAGGGQGDTTFNPVTPDADRLYASVDDFLYNPNFTPATSTRNPWKLAPDMPQRDTTREMLEMARFFLTANSKAPEQNLYNLPRISIWPEMMLPADQFAGKIDRRTAFDKLIAFCSTVGPKTGTGSLPFYFTRQSSGSSGMLLDATGTPIGINPAGDLSPRNLALMAYLKGLTGRPAPGWKPQSAKTTFEDKYGVDKNQILTEIFDYIRCINLADRTGSAISMTLSPPAVASVNDSPYSFTQTTPSTTLNFKNTVVPGPWAFSGPTDPIYVPDTLRTSSLGEVVPILMPDGTRGIGRIPTISEIALIVTRLPDTDPPLSYVYQPAVQPPDNPGAGIYSGTPPSPNALLQFALVPSLFSSMAGYCVASQGFRITFSNIIMSVKVIDKNGAIVAQNSNVFAGIPFAKNGAARGIDSLFSRGQVPDAKWGGTIGGTALALEPGSKPPWATMIVPLSFPVPNIPSVPASRWENRARLTVGEVPPGPLIDKIRPVYLTTNYLEISCTADITITGPTSKGGALPATTNTTGEPIIQTLKISFPKFNAPIPILTPVPRNITTLFNGTTPPGEENFDAAGNQIGQSNINNNAFDPPRYLVDPKSPEKAGWRFANSTTRLFINRGLDYTERDVVRTLALTGNADGNIIPGASPGMQGDVRIIAAKKDIPAGYFQPSDPDYYDNKKVYIGQNSMRLPKDSMRLQTWQYYGELNSVYGALVANQWGDNLGEFKPVGSYPTYRIKPQNGFGQSAIPSTESIGGVTKPINGVMNVLGQAGDWDTGPFWLADGPYCNKPDEGARGWNSATPYLGDQYDDQNPLIESQTFFSPNRMIPSAVMFGSLPTGVMRYYPWQTLLFRPAKPYLPGGLNHPGSATAGPPDHLLLDLFWMPVVEPYAISEPFATAGKINLNQQIAPFTNIHRDTGLRAVLKSVKMGAINPAQLTSGGAKYSSGYKKLVNTGNPYGVVIRRSIDLDNTLKQITDRLDTNKPFVSASEICDISLIPKDVPLVNGLGMKAHVPTGFTTSTPLANFDTLLNAFWSSHKLTGDNSLERPYALIYPRLTTRSNSFTVHVRVQTLAPTARSSSSAYILKANQVQPMGEFRGSFLIERYLDANSASLVDSSGKAATMPASGDTTGLALGPYRFRVVSSKQFIP